MGFTTTVEDAPAPELIPEDTIVQARLLDITDKTINWTDKNTKEAKSALFLNWKWEITGAGEYQGKWVYGSCDARLSNHPSNKFRNWSESLLGRQLGVGDPFDTDELIGLSAEISIKHRADKKDPEKKYAEVDEVIPLDGGFQLSDEPPF